MKNSRKSTKKSAQPSVFDEKVLYDELMRDAKAVGLSESTAKIIIDKVVTRVSAYLATRAVVTSDDISRIVTGEVAQYNKDLAYVYQNRGKII